LRNVELVDVFGEKVLMGLNIADGVPNTKNTYLRLLDIVCLKGDMNQKIILKFKQMKQLTIEIFDSKTGKSFGEKKVSSLHWDVKGLLYFINVAFISPYGDLDLFDEEGSGVFRSRYSKLTGKLKVHLG
jgi:hypothetical protein